MNRNTYGTTDAYEASFITLITGIQPTIQPATAGLIELQFDDCNEVTDAARKYHDGASVDPKQFSRIVARNFAIIRSCSRGGR